MEMGNEKAYITFDPTEVTGDELVRDILLYIGEIMGNNNSNML